MFDCANLSAAQAGASFDFRKLKEVLGDIDVSDQLEKINAARISYVAALVAKKNEKIVKEKRKVFLSKLRAGKGKYQPDLVLRTFIDSAQKNYRWTLKLLLEQEEIQEILVQDKRLSPELIEADDIGAMRRQINTLVVLSDLKAQREKKESKSLFVLLPDQLQREIIDFLDVESTGRTSSVSQQLCQDVVRVKQNAMYLNLYRLNVTDAILKEYIKEYKKLEVINLAHCDEITDVGVQALAAGCPGLKIINLSGCVKVSKACVESLVDTNVEVIKC